ncbi:hypothetical protein S101446_02153 [Komagataeibacter europaeus]|uniref:hypothetical protein n=1 Tax=Komagataeibacter europaeus TaxID=33995 RepID=UPI000237E0D8|nr:hypothetical protein [Komagataeibacter europaeus]ARW17263.1 hypothetical protein S101446_02153 [Komagataeibacter europaeus]
MGRRYGSATAVSYSEGQVIFGAGHFDMATIRSVLARSHRESSQPQPDHLRSILACPGAWLSMNLSELHGWNHGLLGLDGGTIVFNHAISETVTILPVEIRPGGGSLIFNDAAKRGGTLLVHLMRPRQSHDCVQLVFQNCARQFACYDPMTDMTLVGLVPDGDKPDGWTAVRLNGNPWRIDHPVASEGARAPILKREWQAVEHDTVILRLPA